MRKNNAKTATNTTWRTKIAIGHVERTPPSSWTSTGVVERQPRAPQDVSYKSTFRGKMKKTKWIPRKRKKCRSKPTLIKCVVPASSLVIDKKYATAIQTYVPISTRLRR